MSTEPATSDTRRNEVKQAFSDALSSALAPLVGEAPLFDVPLYELRRIVTDLWLQSMADELRRQDLPITAARLALAAGISRSEAQQWVAIQEQRGWVRRKKVTALAIAQVLSTWHKDTRFSGVYNLPLDLSLKAPVGELGFANLIAEVDDELDPEDVLIGLQKAELVEFIGDQWIRCVKRENSPDRSDAQRISLIGEVLSHHVKAGLNNIKLSASAKGAYYQKEFVCDFPLDGVQREEVEQGVRKLGTALLSTLDNNSKSFLPSPPSKETRFCGAGVYYFEVERPTSRSERQARLARLAKAQSVIKR